MFQNFNQKLYDFITFEKKKQHEQTLRIIHAKRNSVFENITREIIESENENLECYKEYLFKWKSFMTSKLESTYSELDEITNERDEYKECLESLLRVYFIFFFFLIDKIFFLHHD